MELTQDELRDLLRDALILFIEAEPGKPIIIDVEEWYERRRTQT